MPEQKTMSAHVKSSVHDQWKQEDKQAHRIEKPDDVCIGTSMPIEEVKPTVSKAPTLKQAHTADQPVSVKQAATQNDKVE